MRLIDADELKKTFNVSFGGVSHAVIAGRLIDETKTVEATPVIHARWKSPDEPPHIKGTVCTNCGGLTFDMGNFCGNCGARMDLS